MSAAENKENLEQFEFKAEMKQLLNLIVHSLYTHPEIFLRELVSNASDAMNKARYLQATGEDILDKGKDLEIRISVDPKEQTFSIRDNGIGMTHEELIDNLGTVARSGTGEFLKKLKEENKNAGDLIGQFGVGFYSVFMVTDKVTVETRHAKPGSKGYRWVSSGEGSYTIEETGKPDRGTTITFKLKDTAKEFAEDWKVRETIRKYSNFADFPIYIGDSKVNTVEALWRKQKSEIKQEDVAEFYKFITGDFEEPLDHLHLSIESAGAQFKALLFIPAKAPLDFMRMHEHKGLQLYSNRIMIIEDCKGLLPEYLQFVRGVVDTFDLPLNVSREMVQNSPVMDKIKGTLTAKIIQWVEKLAADNKDKYLTFYKNFGSLMKLGINADFLNRDKLIELLRFKTSTTKPEDFTSLKEYAGRMKENQKEIYYLSGDNREALERNPNLEYFKKHDIEVLFLTDPVDVFVVPSVMEYDKKPIKAIDKWNIDLSAEEKKEDAKEAGLSNSLVKIFKEALKDKVEDVRISKRLVDSAVTLVTGDKGMDPQLERMMAMMGQNVPKSKKIMEINAAHPVMKNLEKKLLENVPEARIQKYALHLFESAELVEGDLSSRTDYVKRMMEIMEEATK